MRNTEALTKEHSRVLNLLEVIYLRFQNGR